MDKEKYDLKRLKKVRYKVYKLLYEVMSIKDDLKETLENDDILEEVNKNYDGMTNDMTHLLSLMYKLEIKLTKKLK